MFHLSSSLLPLLGNFIFVLTVPQQQSYYIPPQEHFVAQQTQSLLHHKSHGIPNVPSFGWPRPNPGVGVGSSNSASSATSAANAASAFTFGLGGASNGLSSSQIQQHQFIGGAFGLGFGFGGGWYPYPFPFLPNTPSSSQSSSNAQSQAHAQSQTFQVQAQAQAHAQAQANAHVQAQLHAQAHAQAHAHALAVQQGLGYLKPFDLNLLQSSNGPTLLKASDTGWDTSYNVPCGSYRIRPYVIANLKLATSSTFNSAQGKRKRRSNDDSEFEYFDYVGTESIHSDQDHGKNGRLRHYPPKQPQISNREGKSCSWSFLSEGPCKLKFRCEWFQLPAVFSCNENTMHVSDSTPHLNNTFCGNRKPRRTVYNSSSGKLILTFRSHTSSLPAVFDCMVTCTLEASPNDEPPEPQQPPRKVAYFRPLLTGATESEESFNPTTSRNHEASSEESTGVLKNPRIRIGNCKCGILNSHYQTRERIVGGSPASPGEFSWAVALVRKSSHSTRPFCGGTLISDRYVLTAAHCVFNQNHKIFREPRENSYGSLRNSRVSFDVILVEHDINRVDDIPGGSIRVAVDRIIVHPRYDNVTFNYDLALIRLQSPIELSSQYPYSYFRYDQDGFHSARRRFVPEIEARPRVPLPTPICLPPDKEVSLESKQGLITGWGLQQEGGYPSDELLKAKVQVLNDTTCRELYKEYKYPITESMMCAGHLKGKVDACVGDSGGGLVVESNGKHYLAGITSWGRGCGRKRLPGVYTRIPVPGLIEWIRSEASDGVWCI